MLALIPCPSCAELLAANSGDCPWCHRSNAAVVTPGPGHALLLSLGLVVFADGCVTSQAVYGVACTDSGMCGGGCATSESVTGTATAIDGNPLGLAELPTGRVESLAAWSTCTADEDGRDGHGLYLVKDALPWEIGVGGKVIVGSGSPRLTVEDLAGGDRILLEDGALSDGVDRGLTVDGAAAPGLVIRLEVTADELVDSEAAVWSIPLPADGSRTLVIEDGGGTLTVAVDAVE